MQQRDGDHVLHAVVAVGRIVQRALLVDDADAGFLGADRDMRDVFDPAPRRAQLLVQRDRGLDRGLAVELGRVADLEQHVLLHLAAQRPPQRQLLAMHRHCRKAPGRCAQHA
ncbi:hypothetical protein G6F50_014377 [Rhizopus delemar]|uniref:Uncharacterized protein n=1 Tax=Rhizopus delemar TaxID=936053 RepID=A0A9P7C861_9FUNG|nr:hypothetical protein G6F50_014377 [Rhizopus delemar]